MYFTVINCDNYLHIIDEESFPVYHLDYQMLQCVTYNEGALCSACIFQLACSNTLPTNVLYQIASFIQKKFPQLEIDWFATFYHVERNSYLNSAFQLKEMLENNIATSEDEVMDRIMEFEKDESVENLDAILLKIAMMNIINFKVAVR